MYEVIVIGLTIVGLILVVRKLRAKDDHGADTGGGTGDGTDDRPPRENDEFPGPQ